MLKKAKQKSYKSKREFQDDLDLIWTNCYTYNSGEVSAYMHPFEQIESQPVTGPPSTSLCGPSQRPGPSSAS